MEICKRFNLIFSCKLQWLKNNIKFLHISKIKIKILSLCSSNFNRNLTATVYLLYYNYGHVFFSHKHTHLDTHDSRTESDLNLKKKKNCHQKGSKHTGSHSTKNFSRKKFKRTHGHDAENGCCWTRRSFSSFPVDTHKWPKMLPRHAPHSPSRRKLRRVGTRCRVSVHNNSREAYPSPSTNFPRDFSPHHRLHSGSRYRRSQPISIPRLLFPSFLLYGLGRDKILGTNLFTVPRMQCVSIVIITFEALSVHFPMLLQQSESRG